MGTVKSISYILGTLHIHMVELVYFFVSTSKLTTLSNYELLFAAGTVLLLFCSGPSCCSIIKVGCVAQPGSEEKSLGNQVYDL